MTESEKLILSTMPSVAVRAFFMLPEDAMRKALSEAGSILDANGVLSLDRFIEICENNNPDYTFGWKGE